MHARCSAGWIVRHATVAAPQATLYTLTVAESAREPASMNSRRSGGLALAACGETSELAIAVLHGGHQVTAADKPEVDTLDDPAPRGARLWVGLGHWDGAVRSRQCNASPTPPQKGREGIRRDQEESSLSHRAHVFPPDGRVQMPGTDVSRVVSGRRDHRAVTLREEREIFSNTKQL